MWAQSRVIIDAFNYDELEEFLRRMINSIEGRDWAEIVSKLRLLARWEFDNYA
ncbi:Imm8 family immunity protein [Variovorax saccharolyticus]|uniref:Imm8 family immunity protein n=1 Tax=Variovorax saccharolyticus TaxID=3053516 RepID=UPI003369DE9C